MYERQKRLTWARLKVGIIVTITIALVFAAVFFSEAIFSLFTGRTSLLVRMQNVGGLRTGAPVWLLGVEIGTVEDIELTTQYIIVRTKIDEGKLKLIHADARATILTMGLLGDKYVAIDPGSQQEPIVKPGDVIPGDMPPDISDAVETTAQAIGEVENFLHFVDSLARSIASRQGNLTRLLYDSTLYVNLSRAVDNIQQVTSAIRYGDGSLSKMIGDPTLFSSMKSAGVEMGKLGEMLTDTSGNLYRFVADSSLYINLSQASEKLATLLKRVEEGKGLAGAMMSDQKLEQDIKSLLAQMQALLEDFEENPRRYLNLELF